MASVAFSASCYSAKGCKQCETEDSVFSASQEFCGGKDWMNTPSLTWGVAHVTLTGGFVTQQECWDGFQNIIEQCYGKTDGGSFDFNDSGKAATLDVGFCGCE